MALSVLGADLTTAHRAAQLAVRARSIQGLMQLWRGVDPTRLAETIDVFSQAAALLAGHGFDESASAAVRYFESFRLAENAGGTAVAISAKRPPMTVIANDIRGAALKGIIDARRAGMSLTAASSNGLVRAIGTLSKHVLAGGRMTIIGSTDHDRKALGWARVTSTGACTFCRTLSSRGPTYKTEKSADFQAHDHCACAVEPIYRGDPKGIVAVAQTAVHRDEYNTAQEWARSSGTMSEGTSNNALNNYRRWLANGSPEPGGKTDGGNAGNDGSNPV